MNDLLKICAPYKKVRKYKFKFKEKLWISSGLQKSISIKNSIFKKYINKKDPHIKEELHQKYKNYRYTIATLMKKSKQNYFTKYFETNIKNLKNTWKGIKSIISLKNSTSSSPNVTNFNSELTSDPLKIANVFNNYFSLIGEKTQSKTRFSNKNYTDYLRGENFHSFFITPTDIQEVISIISSLSDNKSSGPNSIPTRILKLLKKDISTQLADIFNLCSISGIYATPLKTAKVIPIHKKDSKLECSNYRPIALLSNIDKILEKLMHRRLSNFLDKNKLIYSLQFVFRQNY